MQTTTHTMLEPEAPRRFDGFEIIRHLGAGGMANVYLARDIALGRHVAIKIGATRNNRRARARFALEARALGSVRHPNVVEAFHAGEIDDLPYLATEYIEGRTLHQVRRPLRWRKVAEIAIGLARALEAVHAHGWLHRDVKPSNVMLSKLGEVKLIDFGLARAIDAHVDEGLADLVAFATGTPDLHITATDYIVGTPRFLAPELWTRQPATVQTDLYAMGLVCHELLAGTVPHTGLRGEKVFAYLRSHEIPLPLEHIQHVPGPLVALVDQCVRRCPDERPRSAKEVRERLEAMR